MPASSAPILVTGGAGFVGSRVCRAIAGRGWRFRALDRPGPRLEALRELGGETVAADLLAGEALAQAMRGCRATIHLVAAHEHAPGAEHQRVTVGGTRRVIEAASRQGVRRLLHLSSIKADRDYPGLYGGAKRQAEALVRASSLEFTIFRPALLYGPGELKLRRMAQILRRWPLFPVPGDGSYRIFAVRVDDLAATLLKAIERPLSIGRTYVLAGEQPLSLDELIERIGIEIGRPRRKGHGPKRPRPHLHLPLWLCRAVGALLERLSSRPLVFTDQVLAMQAAPAEADSRQAAADLDFHTPDFADGLHEYLSNLEKELA